jgi:putative aldouronate transport system substrate-binding protein
MRKEKTMKKRMLFLVAFALVVSIFAGCAGSETTTGAPTTTKPGTTATTTAATTAAPLDFDDGKTNAEGLPIVKEPIELEVVYVFATNYGDPNNYLLWDQLAAETGIKFKFRVLNDNQNLNLMYASQDYPDAGFFNAVPSNTVWDEAVQSGDIVNMKPYLDAGLGNAYLEFFDDYPVYHAQSVYSDGGYYFLPSGAPGFDAHRDVWLINQVYLDQLGLTIPSTLDEFTDYLRAIKANAGTGNIPQDVIPFYYLFTAGANASFEDIYTAFGLYEGLRWGPFVEDGVVKHNLTNEKLVDALKYQAMLYAEGLTSPQAFTDDNAAMTLYLQSTDPTMTGFLSYNDNRKLAHWTHMAPVSADPSITPYTRSRPANALKGCVVYSNCEYPAAIVRFFQWLHEDNERWITAISGQEGKAWEYAADGVNINALISSIANLEEQDRGFTQMAMLTNQERFEWRNKNSLLNPEERAYWWKNMYDQYKLPSSIFKLPGIPSCFIDESITEQNNEITTNVWTYANEQLANWVMGSGDIEAEWDAYVAKINGFGWETYLENMQAIYDDFSASMDN